MESPLSEHDAPPLVEHEAYAYEPESAVLLQLRTSDAHDEPYGAVAN
jgi:hypothetical protein